MLFKRLRKLLDRSSNQSSSWTDEGLSTRSSAFSKIEKQRAYEEAGEQADLIQHELENLPIVQDYRQKCRMPVT